MSMDTPPYRDDADNEALRPLLFSIAYRMLGSVRDAEDLVQETLLRMHIAVDRGVTIESRKAYATATVTRLAIDQLRSARHQREKYPGEWLPEPVVAGHRIDPEANAEMSDSLSMAFLVLLENLSPPERAVLLLHDVFGYSFADIADIIGKSEANTRQIAVRARRAVEARRPRFEVSAQRRWELATRFFAAVERGDTDALLEMLSVDAVMYSDGGGRAPSRPRPARTALTVARFLTGLSRRGRTDGMSLTMTEVNGQPGAVIRESSGTIISVMSLDIDDDHVQTIRAVLNPDKLSHLASTGEPAGTHAQPKEDT